MQSGSENVEIPNMLVIIKLFALIRAKAPSTREVTWGGVVGGVMTSLPALAYFSLCWFSMTHLFNTNHLDVTNPCFFPSAHQPADKQD